MIRIVHRATSSADSYLTSTTAVELDSVPPDSRAATPASKYAPSTRSSVFSLGRFRSLGSQSSISRHTLVPEDSTDPSKAVLGLLHPRGGEYTATDKDPRRHIFSADYARCSRCRIHVPAYRPTADDSLAVEDFVAHYLSAGSCDICRHRLVSVMLRSPDFRTHCLALVDLLQSSEPQTQTLAGYYLLCLCRFHHRIRRFLSQHGTQETVETVIADSHIAKHSAAVLELQDALTRHSPYDLVTPMVEALSQPGDHQSECKSCHCDTVPPKLLSAPFPSSGAVVRYIYGITCEACEQRVAFALVKDEGFKQSLRKVVRSLNSTDLQESGTLLPEVAALLSLSSSSPDMKSLFASMGVHDAFCAAYARQAGDPGLAQLPVSLNVLLLSHDAAVIEAVWACVVDGNLDPALHNVALDALPALYESQVQKPITEVDAPWARLWIPMFGAYSRMKEANMIDKRAVQCFDKICAVFAPQSLCLAAMLDGKTQAKLIVLGGGPFMQQDSIQSVARLYSTVTSPIFALQGAFHREWWGMENGHGQSHILRVIARSKLEELCARLLDLALDAQDADTRDEVLSIVKDVPECIEELRRQDMIRPVSRRLFVDRLSGVWTSPGPNVDALEPFSGKPETLPCTHIRLGLSSTADGGTSARVVEASNDAAGFASIVPLHAQRAWLRWVPYDELMGHALPKYTAVPAWVYQDGRRDFVAHGGKHKGIYSVGEDFCRLEREGRGGAFGASRPRATSISVSRGDVEVEEGTHVLCAVKSLKGQEAPIYWAMNSDMYMHAFTRKLVSGYEPVEECRCVSID